MKRATIALVSLGALLLSGGVATFTVLQPVRDEHGKLAESHRAKLLQRRTLESQVQDLEARLKRQAIQALAYFDLRQATDKRREVERKTIETLASLTEIFNDRHLVVQTVLPKAETVGFRKPLPTPSPLKDLLASAPVSTQASQPSPSPPPASLLHKSFQVVIRGEYEDIVSALQEIEALPKAISVNQYEVALIRQPGETGEGDDASVSASALELRFEFSITFLLDAPAASPVARVSHQAPRGCLARVWHWLLPPAYAAELETPVASPSTAVTLSDELVPTPAPAASAPSPVAPASEAPDASRVLDSSVPPPPPAPPLPDAPATSTSSAPIFEWSEPTPAATPPPVRPVRPRARRSPPPRKRPAVRFHAKHKGPLAKPSSGDAPTPGKPQAVASNRPRLGEEPSLRRPHGSAYRFPIARTVVTGRRNPFVPLRVLAPHNVAPTPGLPGLPSPPAQVAVSAAPVYALSGVLLGGAAGPMAVVQVGDKTLTVGIQGVLPGGARVVRIASDHIVLEISGRRTTLKLPR